jgi:phosphatidylglycerol:prolipoprotein diacylglycerol transferase
MWNMVVFGMIMGILFARIYYVIFEWPRFANQSWLMILNPATGGLAIHGALIGTALAAFIYTKRHNLNMIEWLDIVMPTFLLAQAIGRWGNFFNQEAYGQPSNLGFGVVIDAPNRLAPYNDLDKYPASTLFHPTFLYESLWNLLGVGLLVLIERRYRDILRRGDMVLFYAIIYGTGRLWIEGLRVDSLCTDLIGGGCDESLRVAQIASIVLIVGGVIGLWINHARHIEEAVDGTSDTPEEIVVVAPKALFDESAAPETVRIEDAMLDKVNQTGPLNIDTLPDNKPKE